MRPLPENNTGSHVARGRARARREDVFLETVETIGSLQWRHLLTARTDEGRPLSTPTAGYTTWIATLPAERIAAISWAWVVIDPGVITVENVLQVSSNLYPTDERGAVLGPDQRTQVLTRLVSGIDWYDVVRPFALQSRMG